MLPFAPFEDCSIIDRFDAIVRQFPSRLAIQDMTTSLTYAELAELVERILAATIVAIGTRPGPIALLLDHEAALPAAMLAVLAAGRAYIALDPDAPQQHNRSVAADANVCAIISSSDLTNRARTYLVSGLPVIDIGALPNFVRKEPAPRPRADDLAAIYYTSGSEGQAKSVAWSHRALLHWVRSFTEAARISCSDRTLLTFSASASASYRSIYSALLNGASVHMLSPLRLGISVFAGEIRSRDITIYQSVPTLLRRVAEHMGTTEPLYSVRVAYIAGDRVTWRDVDECKRRFAPDVQVLSALSSTETGPCIHTFIDDSWRVTTRHPPLGHPAPGWSVTIVNDDGAPVSSEESGNLVVRSRFIALGNWQGSDLSVRAFPTADENANERVFASGDRVRRRSDGLIEFVGRNDGVIKLHGYRIDPAEVESVLTALEAVRDAAIVVRRAEDGLPLAVVAYVVLRPAIRGLLPRHIQALLAQHLPRYMIPALVHLVDQLPHLPSSKIDRQELARIDAVKQINGSRDGDPLTAQVVAAAESVIRMEGATSEDTIASLGGDSLQELSFFHELERSFGIVVPTDIISQRPTIGWITHWIAGRKAAANANQTS